MQVQYYINLEKICLNLARLIPKSIFEKINEIEYTCRIYKGKTRLEKFQVKFQTPFKFTFQFFIYFFNSSTRLLVYLHV